MTGKIFRYVFLTGALALILCAGLFFSLQYRQNLDEAEATLRQETAYVAQGIALAGSDYLSHLESDKRITWLGPAGEILYDTLGDDLADQSSSPEVIQALAEGEGQSIRQSASGSGKTMYTALRLPDGSVVRLSYPISAVREALLAVAPILWVFVLVLTLSGILAFRAAKQIVRPINEIDPDDPEHIRTYPELTPLVSRLQEQGLTIGEQISELNRRQKEFTALTDNMQEGFLLIDREGIVLSANASALRLLPDAAQGENLFPHVGKEVEEAVREALRGRQHDLLLRREDRSWQLFLSPVSGGSQITGAVLLWMDVTEREQREQLRREFSANVSHELKTPLTSISGFAELMAEGMVPAEKIPEFAEDIRKEARRLIALVEDIMKLSKLDENALMPESADVDLYELAGDTLDSLRSTAESQQVTLQLEGGPVHIRGVWQILQEMIGNLCENSIKYNRPGGSVTVTVGRQDGRPAVTVSDTGIGIPYADQERVFERFYRVDKSHSKEIGGTGLGLSIVKHGAQYHGAHLRLESVPGGGTTVTVLFPEQTPETSA